MARSRPRKPRLSRMDAAVDAMAPFGFPAEKVKKHVKLLLQVYGGTDGWPFIEEYSYKELIDAMLRDVEEEEVAEDQGKSNETALTLEYESGAGTSTRDEGPIDNNFQACIAVVPSCSNTEPKSPEINKTSALTNHIIPSLKLPPANSPLSHRHYRHCYGWIESSDDEDDFVYLKPAPGVFGGKREAALPPNDRTRSRGDRKSRWDLKPGEP